MLGVGRHSTPMTIGLWPSASSLTADDLADPTRLEWRQQPVPDRAILVEALGQLLLPIQINPVDQIPSVRERGRTLCRDRAEDMVVVHVGKDDHVHVVGCGPGFGRQVTCYLLAAS